MFVPNSGNCLVSSFIDSGTRIVHRKSNVVIRNLQTNFVSYPSEQEVTVSIRHATSYPGSILIPWQATYITALVAIHWECIRAPLTYMCGREIFVSSADSRLSSTLVID